MAIPAATRPDKRADTAHHGEFFAERRDAETEAPAPGFATRSRVLLVGGPTCAPKGRGGPGEQQGIPNASAHHRPSPGPSVEAGSARRLTTGSSRRRRRL